MNNRSEAVKKWRRKMKSNIVECMGGCCISCGYNKCNEALELHHLDPTKKEFTIGSIRANPRSWKIISQELDKCVLLCSICHKEYHAGVRILPNIFSKFDIERFTTLNDKSLTKICKVCENKTSSYNTTCSSNCAAKLTGYINWGEWDLENLLQNNNWNKTKVADIINCSTGSILKRMKKLNIQPPIKEKRIKPPIEILIDMITNIGYSATGRKHNVSDNAIRKWVKSAGYDTKTFKKIKDR